MLRRAQTDDTIKIVNIIMHHPFIIPSVWPFFVVTVSVQQRHFDSNLDLAHKNLASKD